MDYLKIFENKLYFFKTFKEQQKYYTIKYYNLHEFQRYVDLMFYLKKNVNFILFLLIKYKRRPWALFN